MNYDLYVITDTAISHGRTHEEIARLAIAGGADVIQLRDKVCSARDLAAAGRRMRGITRKTGTVFIINDRLDVALSCGADGVHLGQNDLPVHVARSIAPRDFIIGVSAGSATEALKAVQDGADYIAASPVFPTAQKTDVSVYCGIEGISQIRRAVDLPLVAIGGIGMHNVREVMSAGADGIAVISAVVGQLDITRAARELKQRVLACKKERFNEAR